MMNAAEHHIQSHYPRCMLCHEPFGEVSRHKLYNQICVGCGINANNKVCRNNKRARKLGRNNNLEKIYLINWVYILHIHGYSCAHCHKHGSIVRLTLDHIVPLCFGGKNDGSNLQPLCHECHSAKDNHISHLNLNSHRKEESNDN